MQTGRRPAALAAGAFVLGLSLLTSPPAARAATLQDLLAVQREGFCSGGAEPPCPTDQLFVPPVPNYDGWTGTQDGKGCVAEPKRCRFSLVDYAGIAAAYIKAHGGPDLHTTFDGFVKERPVGGGQVEITIKLVTHNALMFVSELPPDAKVFTGPRSVFATAPLLFGARALDVLHGAKPALAESLLFARWVQKAGAPLPNLAPLLQDRGPRVLGGKFLAGATGELRTGGGGRMGRADITIIPAYKIVLDRIALKPL
jgi:hypothetical protein